jgi:hypothetical protein
VLQTRVEDRENECEGKRVNRRELVKQRVSRSELSEVAICAYLRPEHDADHSLPSSAEVENE